MKKKFKAVSKEEISLLSKLSEELFVLSMKERKAAVEKMQDLAENRGFSRQKMLYANVMSRVGEHYARSNDLEKAIKIFEDLIEYGKRHKIKRVYTNALANSALCQAQTGKYLEAIDTWKELLPQLHDVERRIAILGNISAGYGYIGDACQTLKYGFEAIALAEESDLERLTVSALINVGTAYNADSLYQKALDIWLKALPIAEKYKEYRSLYNIANNLCLAYNELEDKDNALEFAFKSLENRKLYGHENELATPYNNIGAIYESAGDLDEALEYYQKARDIYAQFEYPSGYANCITNLASIFFKKGDLDTALKHLDDALEINKASDATYVGQRITGLFAKVYAAKGDYKKAFECQKESIDSLSKSLEDLKQNSITKSEADYYRNKIELQAVRYQKQNRELKKKNRIIRKATQELEQSNFMLSDTVEVLNWLLAVITHDLRAPLGNYNRMLGMMLNGEIDVSEHQDILKSLQAGSSNLFKLVDSMLDGIRLQKKKMSVEVQLERANIVPLLQSAFLIYHPIALQKRINLQLDLPAKNIVAYIDQDLFRIVVRNLLNNALKFTSEKGSVNLTVKEEASGVRLSVSDTGYGMNKAAITAIEKGDVFAIQRAKNQDGYGMGLALCQDALKKMNSKISVESELGKGTSISICFPIAPK